MQLKRRVDAGQIADESDSARSLLVLLTIREACVQQRSQSVGIDGLYSECVSADDIERVCAHRWINVGEDAGESKVFLTEEGEAVCSAALSAIPLAISGTDLPRPHWNPGDRELVFDGRLLKRFVKSAPNQERLLERFEQLGWPKRIEDPLPEKHGIVSARRLRDTIMQLNRSMEIPEVHFRADGTGTGVTWVDTSTCGDL